MNSNWICNEQTLNLSRPNCVYLLPERLAKSYLKQKMFQPISRECGTLSRRLSCCQTLPTPAQNIQSNKVRSTWSCEWLSNWIGLLSIQPKIGKLNWIIKHPNTTLQNLCGLINILSLIIFCWTVRIAQMKHSLTKVASSVKF